MGKFKKKYKWTEREKHFLCLKYNQQILDGFMEYVSGTPFLDLVFNSKIRLTGGISSSLFDSDMSSGSGSAMDEGSGTTSPDINNQEGS